MPILIFRNEQNLYLFKFYLKLMFQSNDRFCTIISLSADIIVKKIIKIVCIQNLDKPVIDQGPVVQS